MQVSEPDFDSDFERDQQIAEAEEIKELIEDKLSDLNTSLGATFLRKNELMYSKKEEFTTFVKNAMRVAIEKLRSEQDRIEEEEEEREKEKEIREIEEYRQGDSHKSEVAANTLSDKLSSPDNQTQYLDHLTTPYKMHVFEEAYYCRCFEHVAFNKRFVVVSGNDNILRVWQLDENFQTKSLKRWQCSDSVTCIAIIDDRVAVATSRGLVLFLRCVTQNNALEIRKEFSVGPLISKTHISRIEFISKTRCVISTPLEVFLCDRDFENKTNIEEHPKQWSEQSVQLKSFTRTMDSYELWNLPGGLWGTQIAHDRIMLVSTTRDNQHITVRVDKKVVWHHDDTDSAFECLDLSTEAWILIHDKNKHDLLLVSGIKKKCFILRDSVKGQLKSGSLCTSSSQEVKFVIWANDPFDIRIYSLKLKTLNFELLRRWKSHDLNGSNLIENITTHRDRIAMIWNDEPNEGSSHHSSVLMLVESSKNNSSSTNDLNFPEYYVPPWVYKRPKSSYIIDSAYVLNCRHPRGALLVQEDGDQYIHPWKYSNGKFSYESLLVESEGIVYTKIAMQQDMFAICSNATKGKNVSIQFWQGEKHETRQYDIRSRVRKFISLTPGIFCLATKDKFFNLSQDGCVKHDIPKPPLKSIFYDKKHEKLSIVTNTHAHTYNALDQMNFQKRSSDHWRVQPNPRDQVCLGPSSIMVICDDCCELLEEGKYSKWKMSDTRVSLRHSTEDGFFLMDYSDENRICICYYSRSASKNAEKAQYDEKNEEFFKEDEDFKEDESFEEDDEKEDEESEEGDPSCMSDWKIGVDHDWKVYESGGQFFLLSDDTLGVIENLDVLNNRQKVVRFLFGYSSHPHE